MWELNKFILLWGRKSSEIQLGELELDKKKVYSVEEKRKKCSMEAFGFKLNYLIPVAGEFIQDSWNLLWCLEWE